MKKVSIIIPCHNEQNNIQTLYEALKKLMEAENKYEWQVVMVDDGSIDGTLQLIKEIREKDKRVGFVSLSRNFGKESAMLAGFDCVDGDCAVIMDADLQHPPYTISDMLREWERGYEDIYAQREDRGKESYLRKLLSITYYKILQRLSKVDVLPNVGDFRLLDRKCINSIKTLRETQRYTKGIYCWIGFKKKAVSFQQGDRKAGKSSFNYAKLINLALEGITSYTTIPLRISTIIGIIVSFIAFAYMCYIMAKTIIVGEPVQGFPTLITVILFIGGVQLISIGILGEYIGRIFYETKKRPPYIISEIEK